MKSEFFNYDMTRAILDGRKTATRRLIKLGGHIMGELLSPEPIDDSRYAFSAFKCSLKKNVTLYLAPRHRRGDIIYVREAFAAVSDLPGVCDTNGPIYRADFSLRELQLLKEKNFVWKPAIHMPKEYARVFLRVTNVWAEHLCDISEKQAMAEGIHEFNCAPDTGFAASPDADAFYVTATEAFSHLWNSTILPPAWPLYGWLANPMVWVYEFEIISREEAYAEVERGTA